MDPVGHRDLTCNAALFNKIDEDSQLTPTEKFELAVSLNNKGEEYARVIGLLRSAVNEKVEGAFDYCKNKGLHYLNEDENDSKALDYLRVLADTGHGPSCFAVSNLLNYGLVPKSQMRDFSAVLRYKAIAAEQGFKPAVLEQRQERLQAGDSGYFLLLKCCLESFDDKDFFKPDPAYQNDIIKIVRQNMACGFYLHTVPDEEKVEIQNFILDLKKNEEYCDIIPDDFLARCHGG